MNMHMQKYIMFFLVIVSMNNYTMENEVEIVRKNFHQKIEERTNFFKAKPELSEIFKNFDDIKPYKSCPGKQGSNLKEFLLLVNSKMNGFLNNLKPSSCTEFVNFLRFGHMLNLVNKKFKIQDQYLLNMRNSKLDISLDEKQKQCVLNKFKINKSNQSVCIDVASLRLNGRFCIYTKLQEVSLKIIKHYYLQIPEIEVFIVKEDGTKILDVNNK